MNVAHLLICLSNLVAFHSDVSLLEGNYWYHLICWKIKLASNIGSTARLAVGVVTKQPPYMVFISVGPRVIFHDIPLHLGPVQFEFYRNILFRPHFMWFYVAFQRFAVFCACFLELGSLPPWMWHSG